jgi:hypothetical protein
MDPVHGLVDLGRRLSMVDHGQCLGAQNIVVAEEKGGGDGGDPHRL